MKKYNFKLANLLIFSFMLICFVTGCSNNDAKDASPNSSGTNPNNNSGNSSQNENYTSSQLEKGITSSGAVTQLGKLVVFVKNSNNVPVDMEIEVEFYDANGTIVGSDSDSLIAVGSNTEIAVEMYSTPEKFDNYKIYVDVEQSDEISYHNKLETTHNNNGEEIVVQVKNKSENIIEYITVSVVYYQNGQVVGIDDSIESDIKSGRAANFSLDFPYNKRYDDIRFDEYKVFVNEAYSYEW